MAEILVTRGKEASPGRREDFTAEGRMSTTDFTCFKPLESPSDCGNWTPSEGPETVVPHRVV